MNEKNERTKKQNVMFYRERSLHKPTGLSRCGHSTANELCKDIRQFAGLFG